MASKEYILYNLDVLDEIPRGRENLIIAKKISMENKTRYYLQTSSGSFIDPKKIGPYELRKNDGRFIEVSEKVYDLYVDIIYGHSRSSMKSLEGML